MPKETGSESHKTDVIIIGAGPVGLFAVFELGLLGLKAHLVDILDRPGGQCAELYPEKPILDIPSRLKVTGQELTDDLLAQIEPFKPVFHLGQMADSVERDGGMWRLTTDQGTVIEAPVIVIAGGGGSFTPKKPKVEGLEDFEGKSVFYSVRRVSDFEGKDVVIAGGGDSALDWTMALAPVARSVALVHRRAEFRGVQASVDQVMSLIENRRVTLHTGQITRLNGENGQLASISFTRSDDHSYDIPCDVLLPFYGLTMKLGPIAEFGINLEKNRIPVDTEKFETSVKSIFCIGDMCSYPGKLKLILSGFHEAALMAHGCFHYVKPDEKLRFEHTTSSSSLQEKLAT